MYRYNVATAASPGKLEEPDAGEGGLLDPDDWDAFRALAHEILDRSLDLQERIREEPAWRPVPPELEPRYRESAPMDGVGEEAVWEDVRELVLPYRSGNPHPRFWGWVGGTGSPLGMLAELIAAGLNNSAPFDDAASRVERQVIDWMKEVMGFPARASGVLTSGGSVANLVGMAVGRDAQAGADVPAEGLAALDGRILVYTSTEAHASVHKAAQVLGLGRRGVRLVPVDDKDRIRIELLRERIAADREAGHRPAVVVGNAGTVNTGAVDDLDVLADLVAEEDLWLHVDGAFGALARLSPEYRSLVEGIERADSVAFDFHKWMCTPYAAGCVLVRDAEAHRRTFDAPATYLEPPPRGTGSWTDSPNRRGPQLSRAFTALKIWMVLRAYGFRRHGELVTDNIRQARYLARLVDEHPRMERLAPVALNVVTFRYTGEPATASPDPSFLDALNLELLMRLQERGVAVPSSTRVRDAFALRCAIVNHRSRDEDFDLLVEATAAFGDELLAEGFTP